MVLDLHAAFTGGAQYLCSSRLVDRVVKNPIVVALAITALVLVIVCACMGPPSGEDSTKTLTKMGLWVFFGVAAVVFVHYYALRRHLQNETSSEGLRSAAAAVHQSMALGGGYSVPVRSSAAPWSEPAVGGGWAPLASRAAPPAPPAPLTGQPADGDHSDSDAEDIRLPALRPAAT